MSFKIESNSLYCLELDSVQIGGFVILEWVAIIKKEVHSTGKIYKQKVIARHASAILQRSIWAWI